MSTLESTMVRIRRALTVWWIALAIGSSSVAVAGPGEDLIAAAARGDGAAVQALLDQGIAVDSMNALGTTALMTASLYGHLDVVQALLANGADVNAKSKLVSATALMAASRAGHLNVVQLLLAKGADVNAKANGVNAKPNAGETALILASRAGHLDVVQALLDKGADVAAKLNLDGGATALIERSGGAVDRDRRRPDAARRLACCESHCSSRRDWVGETECRVPNFRHTAVLQWDRAQDALAYG
jgi:uncharacterized protein